MSQTVVNRGQLAEVFGIGALSTAMAAVAPKEDNFGDRWQHLPGSAWSAAGKIEEGERGRRRRRGDEQDTETTAVTRGGGAM